MKNVFGKVRLEKYKGYVRKMFKYACFYTPKGPPELFKLFGGNVILIGGMFVPEDGPCDMTKP